VTADTRFVPWVRPTNYDGDAVVVRVAGRDVTVPFSRYGPGDITGIAIQQVRRRDPAPGSRSFPPNLFPAIEFTTPSLPWLMSPDDGVPTPWVALIVVRGDSSRLATLPGAQCQAIDVRADELPPHDQLGLWAHVQLDTAATSLDSGVSRLLAPCALAPTTDYLACLVPTFEAGLLAGLGETVPDPRSTAPAWAEAGVTLPVYDSWAFTTTERGDIETLARRLTARDLSAASRPLALDAGSVTGDVDGRVAPLLGALHPVGASEAWAPMAADAAATTLTGELERSGGAPVVGLPVYGSTASGSTDVAAGWSRQLNLDPRRRAAAGLGAAMVRDHQEALVDEAWRQAGDIDRATREHQGARLADLAASRLRTRMIEPLTAASALVTMAPALARTTAAPGTTQRALVADSAVPPAMLDAPLRRIAATKLPRAARSAGQGIRTAIAVQNAQVLFPGGPPPAPVSTVTLGAVQAELGTTPVNTGIVPPGVVTPPIGPGPIVHGGGHVLHGGPALHADLATGSGADADVASGSGVTAAAPSPALTAAIATAAASIDLTITATQSTMVSQLLPSIEADVSQVFTVTAPHALSWTPPPPTPTPATATSRARARLVVTGGIVFDLPVGMRTTPRFAQPLAAWLEPGLLLAGVDLPPDTAGLLEVNAGFVEALLVGANHELARELLWRGVPLDRRATLLTQFFEAEGTTPPAGLQPVAEWTATDDLGGHVSFGEQVVLILRSHLVSHLDQTTIFLAPEVADGEFRKPGTDQLMPTFRGTAGLDTAYFGFPIDEASLRTGLGWYLVIQELVGAVRFGLDEEATTPMRTWNDLGWTSVAEQHGYVDATPAPAPPPTAGGLAWGADAAHMAGICMQRPVRVSIHTSLLLPGGG